MFGVKVAPDRYNTYACIILFGLNFKSLTSAFDRLSKGYLSDSEAIFKKTLESLLSAMYFNEKPLTAKQWIKGKSINKLTQSRKSIAQALDKINNEKHIFPTDYPTLFEFV